MLAILFIKLFLVAVVSSQGLFSAIAGRLYTDRTGASAVWDGNVTVLILGGFDTFRGAIVEDTSQYSLENRGVFPIYPGIPFAYGSAAVDGFGNIFYFGGSSYLPDGRQAYSSAIWKLRFDDHVPIQVANLPEPNSVSAAVLGESADIIYVVGGFNGERRLNTILRFNTTTYEIEEAATFTHGQAGPSAAFVQDTLYILGGDNPGNTRDIWTFTPATGIATIIEEKLISDLQTAPAVVIGNVIYLVGTGPQDLGYITRFDTETNLVDQVTLANPPPPRYPYYGVTATYYPTDNRIFVYGGKDTQNIDAVDKIMYIQLELEA